MTTYTPVAQLSFDNFIVPSYQRLSPTNRWVRLAQIVPWDKLAMVFMLSPTAPALRGPGRPTHDLRLVMATLLLQRFEDLSDERTLELICENVYVQHFCGLPGFTATAPFEVSCMTYWRKWLGDEGADLLAETLVDIIEQRRRASAPTLSDTKDTDAKDTDAKDTDTKDNDTKDNDAKETDAKDADAKDADAKDAAGKEQAAPDRGTLLLDATCAPGDIAFPTDVGLLNAARQSAEAIVDELYRLASDLGAATVTAKPRTYRRKARKSFLAFVKLRRAGAKRVRKQVRAQLQFLERDLRHVDDLLAALTPFVWAAHAAGGEPLAVLAPRRWKRLRVCHEVARQQRLMYEANERRCDDRIVSLAQPHLRPIVRGKASATTEFGPKFEVSLVDGLARLERYEYDAYYEGDTLVAACERYRQRTGNYPSRVLVDAAYLSADNRKYLKACGTRWSGKPLGRPPTGAQALAEYKARAREAIGLRNPVEGWFGTAKTRYGLRRLSTRTAATSCGEVILTTMAINLIAELRRLWCARAQLSNTPLQAMQRALNQCKAWLELQISMSYRQQLTRN